MMIDDNIYNLTALKSIVIKALKGYTEKINFIEAADGQIALDKYQDLLKQNKKLDIMFTDINMP